MKPAHLNHPIYSICQVTEDHAVSVIALLRPVGDRDFSDRERLRLRFFHGEIGRLIGRSLASGLDPDPLRLPRREKETLACLLEGDSEKQVAARLGVSPSTTHEYIKSLYRRFSVQSRAELLAYFLRRHRALLRFQDYSKSGDDFVSTP
jgi:DNA-binding CsgD family transcriptional regulator